MRSSVRVLIKEVTFVPAEADRLRRTPLQEIFWTRTSLLLTVLVVVAGLSLWISSMMDPGAGKTLLTSVGTGTLISAVVGFGQTLITATASQRAMVTPVIEESRRALEALSAEYRSLNKEFFPTHVFEATTDPDPMFNRVMTEDLDATRHYFFRGFSGRHAAARLLLSRTERELRVVIADPRDEGAIGGRARYLLRSEEAGMDYETIQKRLNDEISIGLVGLFLARSRCSLVDITVVADPPLDRLEVFDESVWVTLYSDIRGATTLYPRTLRFSEGSFLYNKERSEFLRVSQSRSGRHFRISTTTTRADFLALYEKITGSPLSEENFLELEGKFHTFRKEFTTIAELNP
ncbi:hypothetical protein NQK81_22435 [Amycolatopsis roodepoortensis]|uniref:hypothetical protein n=1 Tax=Amycolatopsis roodepoortensis TaxID=700274 RepID=UPI001CEF4BE1|nr:hypothetical protein [Amycolatopsis roodepoortensis]UUV36270.1 hypothetical protein NQK81_22435 [Amycolatopsis roodepoortensis]